jgi:GT2 family glycosyltransferase
MAEGVRYTAGIVHFGDIAELATCLASLVAQCDPPSRIFVIDHGGGRRESNDDQLEVSVGQIPIDRFDLPNRGYSAGANHILATSWQTSPDAEFILVLNSDVRLDPAFSAALISAMSTRPDVALASGKLMRPCGRLIDSAGITMSRSRRFMDRGSDEPDDGQFDVTETTFAVSGAAIMLRAAFVSSLAVDGEVFDEDFFVYHEDTDLAWRARLLGFESLYVADARATHVRGWRRGQRDHIAPNIRRHSFKNRYLEMIKNERPLSFLRDLPFIFPMEIARFGFALIADRALMGAYRDAAVHARRAWHKRRVIRRNARSIPARAGTTMRVGGI